MSNINRINQLELGTEVYYASGRRWGSTNYNKATVVKRTDRRATLAVQFGEHVREITFGSDASGWITRELKTAANERPSESSYLIPLEEGDRRIADAAALKEFEAIRQEAINKVHAFTNMRHSSTLENAEAAIEALQAFVVAAKARKQD